MGVAPIPVVRLLPFAGLREFVVFLVVVGQIGAPSVVLAVIPVVVVLVMGIIDSDLNPVVLGSGSGQYCDWRNKGGSQQERTNVTMCKAHVTILQENPATSVAER